MIWKSYLNSIFEKEKSVFVQNPAVDFTLKFSANRGFDLEAMLAQPW